MQILEMLPVSDPLGCVELAHGRNEVYHVTSFTIYDSVNCPQMQAMSFSSFIANFVFI